MTDGARPASLLSAEVRLLRHPFAVYRELAQADDPRPVRTIVERTIFLFTMIAASVAFISAGRLTIRLLVGTTASWAAVAVIEWVVVILTHLLARPKISLTRAIGLYMAGNAPLLSFLLVCAAMCIFSPDVYATFTFALRTLVLPLFLLGTLFYGWALSYAYYRAALDIPRRKAVSLLFIDVALKLVLVTGWYLAINNIVPQVIGTEG